MTDQIQEPAQDKKPYESKTLWVALVAAIAAFFPGVQGWISAHAEAYGMILAGVFAGLRMVTKGKISIS